MIKEANIRNSRQQKQSTMKFQLLMQIEFGTPSTRCRNFGVCTMMPIENKYEILPQTEQKSKGLVTVYNPYRVEIDFFRSSLSNETYEKFFSSGAFLVEDVFTYTPAQHDEKRLAFEIKKGKYLIQDHLSLLKVIFQ